MRNIYPTLLVEPIDRTLYRVTDTSVAPPRVGYLARGEVKVRSQRKRDTSDVRLRVCGRRWHVVDHEYVTFKKPERALDALRDYWVDFRVFDQAVDGLRTSDAHVAQTHHIPPRVDQPARELRRDVRQNRRRLVERYDGARPYVQPLGRII